MYEYHVRRVYGIKESAHSSFIFIWWHFFFSSLLSLSFYIYLSEGFVCCMPRKNKNKKLNKKNIVIVSSINILYTYIYVYTWVKKHRAKRREFKEKATDQRVRKKNIMNQERIILNWPQFKDVIGVFPTSVVVLCFFFLLHVVNATGSCFIHFNWWWDARREKKNSHKILRNNSIRVWRQSELRNHQRIKLISTGCCTCNETYIHIDCK